NSTTWFSSYCFKFTLFLSLSIAKFSLALLSIRTNYYYAFRHLLCSIHLDLTFSNLSSSHLLFFYIIIPKSFKSTNLCYLTVHQCHLTSRPFYSYNECQKF